MPEPGLDDGTRALLDVSVAVSAEGDVEAALSVAESMVAGGMLEVTAVEEALLQSYLFCGYPAALNALAEWRRVSGRGPVGGVAADWEAWPARGAETCGRVYGDQYDRLRENVARLHPDMERWMVVEGYGKVLARPGLDLGARELCIVALLAPRDTAPQQYAHLRGALNVGVPVARVNEAVEHVAAQTGEVSARRLREQWESVRTRYEEKS